MQQTGPMRSSRQLSALPGKPIRPFSIWPRNNSRRGLPTEGLDFRTMRELARVVKPGGRVAMVEFGVPSGIWRPLWWLYTRIGLPLGGRVVAAKWFAVGAFLGPSIERFYALHSPAAVERYWQEAGLGDVRTLRMSLGGGVVMSATKVEPPQAPAPASLAPAFYAARGGGWRDYWTLLHPPYTAWHLSYVLLGAALSPAPDPRR